MIMKKDGLFKRVILSFLTLAVIFVFGMNIFSCKDEPEDENNGTGNNGNNNTVVIQFPEVLKGTDWVTKEGDTLEFDSVNKVKAQFVGKSKNEYTLLTIDRLEAGGQKQDTMRFSNDSSDNYIVYNYVTGKVSSAKFGGTGNSNYERKGYNWGNGNPGGNGGETGNGTGITWTVGSRLSLSHHSDTAWGNDKFVAVGLGEMAYSSDGLNWIPVPSSNFISTGYGGVSEATTFTSIVWGNDKFVAVSAQGDIFYSSNGISWTKVVNSTFSGDDINSITWGNNRFVAVGNKMAYSNNGITWTAVTVTSSTFGGNSPTINDIAWGNNKFVAGGGSKMSHSSDGINWTAVGNTTFNDGRIMIIVWGNNKFIAWGGSQMAYSSDFGVTWIEASIFDTLVTNLSIAWGNNKFVAVGYANGPKAAYSLDGITWTAINIPFYGKIVWGDNKFVIAGSDGSAYWDGNVGN
jgi:hypothetical protein